VKSSPPAPFVAFQNMQELDRHPEVRKALLDAMIQDGINSGPGIAFEELREQHRAKLRKYANTEPPAK
jgi:hypothetical protein